MKDFDRMDLRILNELQNDSSLSNADLAERIGLSANACWRRTKRLEDGNIIRKRVALLSQSQLKLDVTVFVGIKTNEHNDKWLWLNNATRLRMMLPVRCRFAEVVL